MISVPILFLAAVLAWTVTVTCFYLCDYKQFRETSEENMSLHKQVYDQHSKATQSEQALVNLEVENSLLKAQAQNNFSKCSIKLKEIQEILLNDALSTNPDEPV